jgi:hypothetical protein
MKDTDWATKRCLDNMTQNAAPGLISIESGYGEFIIATHLAKRRLANDSVAELLFMPLSD